MDYEKDITVSSFAHENKGNHEKESNSASGGRKNKNKLDDDPYFKPANNIGKDRITLKNAQ